MKTQIKSNKKQFKFATFNESETRKNYGVSIVLYSIIAILSFLGMTLMYNFFRSFSSTIDMRFKNFTILSNIFMGLVAIMMIVILAIARKNKEFIIPKAVSIINLIGTVCVALTMFITVFLLTPGAAILGPEKSGGNTPISLFSRSNLVFHLVLPVMSIFTYLFYAKTGSLSKKDCLWTLIPIFAYLVLYVVLAYTHINPETGKPYPQWDTYKFCQFGVGGLIGFAILVPGVYLGLVYLIWFGNQKIKVSKFFMNVLTQSVLITLVIAGSAWINTKEETWETFKYFTNWSNFLYGIGSVIYLTYICLEYKGKVKNIPEWVSIVRLITTVAVAFTFIVVVFVFTPVAELWAGWSSEYTQERLYEYRNIIFHLFVPIIAIMSYLMLEKNKLNWKNNFYSTIFPFVYMVIYVALIYTFAHKGIDTKYYDWYYLHTILGDKGSWSLILIAPIACFGISFLLWYINRKNSLDGIKDMDIFDKRNKTKKEKLIAVKQPAFAELPLDKVTPAKKAKK